MHAPRLIVSLAAAVVLSGGAPALADAADVPPTTARKPVVDTLQGQKITDDYRWLEDWDDAAVQAWSASQNEHAREFLDALAARDKIEQRVTELLGAQTDSYSSVAKAGDAVLAMKRQPPKQQPFLIVMGSLDSVADARVVVDPNTLDPSGMTTIDWFVPSPDGKLVAVSMSSGGSESGDVHLYEIATGQQVDAVIERVQGGTAGGDLAWTPDSKGYYYTRYPRAGERPEGDMDFYVQVFHHTLGQDPAKDRYEIGRDFVRIAEIVLEADDATGRVIASVQNGDGGEFEHHLRTTDGKWTKFSSFDDRIVSATFAPNDGVYVISFDNSPKGQILRLPIEHPDMAHAKVVVDAGEDAIVADFFGPPTIVSTPGRLYLTYQLGGPSEFRVFDHSGKRLPGPKQPEVGSVGGLAHLEGDDVAFVASSFIDPPAWFRFSPQTGKTERTALFTVPPALFRDVEVVREFAVSKDGTKVPINIIRRKGMKMDGTAPCVLYGYGGYGVNIEPGFSLNRLMFLEQGVTYAVANIRGGGEYGEEWHLEGNLTKKQNVFDDFYACAKHMVDRGYTSPQRLALQGGSNGGLLMGAVVTQHPDVCRAVHSAVGIYDMLRVELSPNGAFNVPEFGTVQDPEQFAALYAYSPYHHVQDGAAYPAILFTTGANDPRVDPMQSRKMTARMQAANASSNPILLRTTMKAGHGIGTSLDERIAETTDVMSFLFHELGVEYQTPDR